MNVQRSEESLINEMLIRFKDSERIINVIAIFYKIVEICFRTDGHNLINVMIIVNTSRERGGGMFLHIPL